MAAPGERSRRLWWPAGTGFIVLVAGCGSSVETEEPGGSASSSSTMASASVNVSSSTAGTGGSGGGGGAGGAATELCTTVWAKSFGGTGSDYGRPVLLPDESLVLGGSFADSIDFGLGPLVAIGETDIFLVKLDGAGNALWDKSFTSMETAQGYALDHDAAGNLLVGGVFRGTLDLGGPPLVSTATGTSWDVFLAKLDPSGNHLWSKRFGAPGCSANGCAITSAVSAAGEVFIAVVGDAVLDFGGGPLASTGFDFFLARFDSAGNHLWSQHYGDVGIQWATVARNGSGQLWLHGFFEGTLPLGNVTLTSQGSHDGYVAKLDDAGSIVWLQQLSGPSSTMVLDVEARGNQVRATGRFYGEMTVGSHTLSSDGDSDVFVASFDDAGNVVSAWSFGGNNSQAGLGVTQTTAGHVVVGGQFDEHFELAGEQVQSAGWIDAFWSAFDETGTPLGSCTYGSIDFQTVDDLKAVSDGVLFTALYADTVDFGTGPLTAVGDSDLVVGKLASPAR